MPNANAVANFFRKNTLYFVLCASVLILLYICIAERGRISALNGLLEIQTQDVKKLEQDLKKSKQDFYNLQNLIRENDSIFYSRPAYVLSVDSLLFRMSNRFRDGAFDKVSRISGN